MSDVANAERWLADARSALSGGEAKVAKLKEHVAAAEDQIPVLSAAVEDAEAALEAAQTKSETFAQAGVAEAAGSVN